MSLLLIIVRPPASGRARKKYDHNTDDHTIHHRPSYPRNQKPDSLVRVPFNCQGREAGSGGGRDRARVSCSDPFEHRPALILRAFGMSGPAASTRRAPTFLGHSTTTRQSGPSHSRFAATDASLPLKTPRSDAYPALAPLSFCRGGFQEPVSKVFSQESGRTWRDELRHKSSYQYVIPP